MNLYLPKLLMALVLFFVLQGAAAQWRPQFENHLQELKFRQTKEIGFEVYNIAMTWAAAGHVRQANELLARFWKYRRVDPHEFHNSHPALEVMWALSGQRPDTIPFALSNVDEIVQASWDDAINPAAWAWEYRQRIMAKSWKELSTNDLYVKAILLSYDSHGVGHRSPEDQRREAVLAFERLLQADSLPGFPHSTAGSTGAIIAASLGDTALARTFIVDWGKGYLTATENLSLGHLMMDTATARLLLAGVLEPVWGLTEEECERELGETEKVLEENVKKGPSLVYGQLTLRELLERISQQAIKDSMPVGAAAVKARWLGHAPAPEATIAAAEKRLGVKLPEDYKSFLRISNGFYAAGSTVPSFLPVEKIGWLKDKDKMLMSIWGDNWPTDDAEEAAGFRRSILIGGENEEQQFLLVPPGGKHPEWQYWFFATWVPGIEHKISLRFYLEGVLMLQERMR